MRLMWTISVLCGGFVLTSCKNLAGTKSPLERVQAESEISPQTGRDDRYSNDRSAYDDSNYRIIASEADLPVCESANQSVIIYIDESKEYKICENLNWRTTQVRSKHDEKPESVEKPESIEKPESAEKSERYEANEKHELHKKDKGEKSYGDTDHNQGRHH